MKRAKEKQEKQEKRGRKMLPRDFARREAAVGGTAVNIYDIAREAGVSIATVSRVVNGSGAVGKATRGRVEAVLARYRYTPNPAARGLATGAAPAGEQAARVRPVALLAEDTRDFTCMGLLRAAQRLLEKAGFACLLFETGGGAGVGSALEAALHAQAGALLVAGMSGESEQAVAAFGAPAVVVNHPMQAPGVYCVTCDQAYGMMLAVGQLAGAGRASLLFVRDQFPEDETAVKLTEGFETGMAMNGLDPSGRVVQTERGAEGGFAAAEALLRAGRKFDGVVCGDDSTAAGFMQCLRRNFLEVPDDVYLVGFHNSTVAECTSPALTSVDCRPEKLGEAAANVLLAALAGKTPPARTPVLPRLVRRRTA